VAPVAVNWQESGRIALLSLFALLGVSAAARSLPGATLDDEEIVENLRYYSVEIIVFEYASTVSAGNEIFDPVKPAEPEAGLESAIPVFGDMAAQSPMQREEDELVDFGELTDAAEEQVTELELIPSLSGIDFKLLTAEELSMGNIHERLMTLDAYQPVLWGGWVQSTHEKEATPSIRLRSIGTPPIRIDGTLTLYLKNYLHLAVDLTREQQLATVQPVYRQEKPSPGELRSYDDGQYGVVDRQTIIYRIQEDRLFNSGQLRYYDHPKFGVLARVNRIEQATPEEENEEKPPRPSMLSSTE
jgi:peptidoglycan-binding protein CsiV